jgi:hypothetical protein
MRRGKLARRYGHTFRSKAVNAIDFVREFTRKHTLVVSGAIGAGAGALIPGAGIITSVALGAVAGVAVEKLVCE